MTGEIDLKQIERKAFRSTYQDGLWDIYWGLIVICMGFFIARPEQGYSAWNIYLMLASFLVSYSLFWLGKKFITVPRMGQVVFGPTRKMKKVTLAVILGIVIIFQVAIVLISVVGWLNKIWMMKVDIFLQLGGTERLMVAAIGALFLGPSMILIAYFNDFPRGYYIAILMTLAVFLMILLNQPIYAVILGLAIVVPGLVLFFRFLQKYPLRREEADNE
jgi:hypothetical protein